MNERPKSGTQFTTERPSHSRIPFAALNQESGQQISAALRPASMCSSCAAPKPRSEEHTSELQSLMRISYAVFCLKKQTISTQTTAYFSQPLVYTQLTNSES